MKYLIFLPLFALIVECDQSASVTESKPVSDPGNQSVSLETSSDFGFSPLTTDNQQLDYVLTEKGDLVDQYFSISVPDPYRWLEDDNSPQTKEWVRQQNVLTNSYMENIGFRDDVRNRLEQLYNYTKYSAPFKEGSNYFYYKKEGLQNQSVLYKSSSIQDEGEVFLDPNQLSDDGTVAISTISVNKDGTLFAYAKSVAGSDWKTLHVKDIETGDDLSDLIEWAKFTGIAWYGNGFYYGAYPQPEEGDELSSSNEQMTIFYHEIGTAQTDDRIIYREEDQPKKYFGANVTDDEKFLIITGGLGTSGNDVKVKDLSQTGTSFVTVKSDMDSDAYVIGNVNDELFMLTNHNAPNMRVVKFSLDQPNNWVDVIPEGDIVISSVSLTGGQLFVRYTEDVKHNVYTYDYDGNKTGQVELPGQGTVSGFSGKIDDKEVFYTFTSLTQPRSIYRYDVASGESSIFKEPQLDFDAESYETTQVFYPSKDGTKIPMYIVHKKGIELDGNNPTWLYAYGGFDSAIMPRFNSLLVSWLEQGGVYALANIRGGSEYGSDWHNGGRLLNKQNCFDDFISAAEYLIGENYTSTSKLAVNGRSNGGLLVGAVMTQRPDLFGVCIPAVGVLDMLRYEEFTIGYAWASDYGTVKEEEHFNNLYSYSPLHNVKDGQSYPPTMIITADHDDRVVPAHSFKYTARLQEAHTGNHPILIRVDVNSGHGSGKPTSKILDEWADVYSFTMYNLGVQPNY